METTNQRIARFSKHFRDHLANADRLKVGASTDQGPCFEAKYIRVVYVAILDALSQFIYPKRTNRARMISFLREFSGWSECEKVSFTHLARLLQLRPEPEFQPLREYAIKENAAKWQPLGKPIYLSTDPTISEIKKLWPNLTEYREGDARVPRREIALEDLQHANLLYQYRNSLVHELRQKDEVSSPIDQTDEPYYIHSHVLGDSWEKIADSWDLVYPLSFFKRI